jgi:hypothetical protein
MMITWANEDELWGTISPRLRGWPRRLEAAFPAGMPDAFTLWKGQTHWIELKLGKPSRSLMEPKQIEFGLECIKRGVSYRVCVGHQGRVLWYPDFSFTQVDTPKYYAPIG